MGFFDLEVLSFVSWFKSLPCPSYIPYILLTNNNIPAFLDSVNMSFVDSLVFL
jgi:hypothetical protein